MGRARALNDAQADFAVAEYARGRTIEQIARGFGCSKSSVNRLLHARGVAIRKPGGWDNAAARHAGAVSEDEVRTMLDMYASGRSANGIAHDLGRSSDTVLRYLHRAGVEVKSYYVGPNKVTEERVQRMVELLEGGTAPHEIAQAMGLSYRTVVDHLRDRGCDLRAARHARAVDAKQARDAEVRVIREQRDGRRAKPRHRKKLEQAKRDYQRRQAEVLAIRRQRERAEKRKIIERPPRVEKWEADLRERASVVGCSFVALVREVAEPGTTALSGRPLELADAMRPALRDQCAAWLAERDMGHAGPARAFSPVAHAVDSAIG